MAYTVPDSACLGCGAPLGFATNPFRDGGPEPGARTVCLECGTLMAFGEGLRLRQLTDAEMLETAGDPRLIALQQARGKVMKGRR